MSLHSLLIRFEPVPDHILDGIEQLFGPIRLMKRTLGFSRDSSPEKPGGTLKEETDLEITLKEFVRSCGSSLTASLKLGVSTLTLQKLLSGSPVSAATAKKVLTALDAVGCSITQERADSSLHNLYGLVAIPGLSKSPANQRSIYPSTIRKVQKGLLISKATQRKLGISQEEDTTVPVQDAARVNPATALASRLKAVNPILS